METVIIRTVANPFTPFFTTAPAPAAFAEHPNTVLDPAKNSNGTRKDGVLASEKADQCLGNYVEIYFWGTHANNDTFNARVLGWKRTKTAGQPDQWVSVILADISCTLCDRAGAGSGTNVPLTTDLVVDTITLNSGINGAAVLPASGTAASDGVALLRLDLSGFDRIQLVPGTGSGTTFLNAAASWF